MKLQFKFDKDSVRQFFLDHTEKILFGVVVVGFLLVTYQAATRKGYLRQGKESTPDQLTRDVDAARLNIDKKLDFKPEVEFKPPPPSEGYTRIVQRERQPIVATNDLVIFAPPKFERNPRGDPRLYQVRALRGKEGRGKVVEGADANKAQGRRWVVLTGVVPVKEQADEYDKSFRDASYYNPATDVPAYVGFYVQRVEVEPGDSGEPDWTAATLTASEDSQGVAEKGDGRDHAAGSDVEAALCWPSLPRLEGDEWGDEIFHPGVPRKPAEPAEKTAEPKVKPKPKPTTPPKRGTGGSEEALGHAAPGIKPDDAKPVGPPVCLFRFFDDKVEPGKTYRYRVFVKLRNPNFELPEKFVKSAAMAKQGFLRIAIPAEGEPTFNGEWSKPSPPISVRADIRMYATLKQKAPPSSEESPALRIWKWVQKQGNEVSKVFLVSRGMVANFKSGSVDFKTEEIVVDTAGGGKPFMGGKNPAIYRPLVLTLDEHGRMRLHEEESTAAAEPEPTEPEGIAKDTATEPETKEPDAGTKTTKPAVKGKAKPSSKGPDDLESDPMFQDGGGKATGKEGD